MFPLPKIATFGIILLPAPQLNDDDDMHDLVQLANTKSEAIQWSYMSTKLFFIFLSSSCLLLIWSTVKATFLVAVWVFQSDSVDNLQCSTIVTEPQKCVELNDELCMFIFRQHHVHVMKDSKFAEKCDVI